MTTIAYMEELFGKFGKNFALVSCLFGTVMREMLFVYNGASRHMMRSRDIFTSMAKEPKYLHVELGDNTRCAIECIGIMQFSDGHREYNGGEEGDLCARVGEESLFNFGDGGQRTRGQLHER